MTNVLVIGSTIAVVARLAAIVLLLVVAREQYRELKPSSALQQFKRRLLGGTVLLVIMNIPVLYLNWQRTVGHPANNNLTAFATATNAVGLLIYAVLWFGIWKRSFKPSS